MTTYTLGLALEDFVPVILSSVGLFLITQMILQVDEQLGRMAQAGWVLVTVGGLLKATWKLTMALTGGQTDLVWFDKGMFLWLAIGFTLLAMAMWQAAGMMRGKERPLRPWLYPAVPLALTLFAILSTGFPNLDVNSWRFVLLGIMTIGSVALSVMLIQQARRLGLTLAAVLFAVNIVVAFILSGLARIPDQTIPLQWTEQILNTLSQGAFLYAAWQLVQTTVQQGKMALAT
ncbi:MAG: hypothetical protein AAF614_33410 [Chloroflexota bacterium]